MTGGPFPRDAERCFPVCDRHPTASGYQFKGDEMWCSECWSDAHRPAWSRTSPGDLGYYWYCAEPDDPPRPVYITRTGAVIGADQVTMQVGDVPGYWLGPLPVPTPPAVEGEDDA
jgi:hypothetical protein